MRRRIEGRSGRVGATERGSVAMLVLAVAVLAAPAAAQVGSPAGAVPREHLERRRAALLDRLGVGMAVVSATSPRDIEGDYPQDSDFRQDNDFFYLTGLETPDAALLLIGREAGRDETILYLQPRAPQQERWTGPTLGPGPEAVRRTGVTEARSAARLAADLDSLEALYGPPSPSVAEWIAALRLVKDADELGRLRRAIAITAEAQRAAMRAARPGIHEYELEAVIEYVFRRNGAERVGFPSIVGSGPNATILHYDENRRRTEPGDLIVIDIGAEFGYYSADITRTIPVSGRFTDRQRALYELVLGAQRAAIDSVRPGTTVARLTRVARSYLRDHSGQLCAPVRCDRYFVHGLSHWLGMDVHDVGDYATPLAPGMVLTIEPGVYIPEEEIGIRIEDDILVTERGAEILSAEAPREPDAIERLMAERSAFDRREP